MMIENLKKWMQINDVESTSLVAAGEEIVKNSNLSPVIFTQKGAILHYFAKLINEEISLEDFFYIGDSTGNFNTIVEKMYSSNMDAISYITTKQEINEKYGDGKIFVLDQSLETKNIKVLNIFFI